LLVLVVERAGASDVRVKQILHVPQRQGNGRYSITARRKISGLV